MVNEFLKKRNEAAKKKLPEFEYTDKEGVTKTYVLVDPDAKLPLYKNKDGSSFKKVKKVKKETKETKEKGIKAAKATKGKKQPNEFMKKRLEAAKNKSPEFEYTNKEGVTKIYALIDPNAKMLMYKEKCVVTKK